MKHSFLILAMTVSMLVATPFAHATIITYTANLSGANEAPPNVSPATGSALVTIDNLLNTLSVNISFTGLTVPATAAHLFRRRERLEWLQPRHPFRVFLLLLQEPIPLLWT
jgi:hypothetical protein